MFAGELKARQARLEREQARRAEEARRKAERQRAAAERAAERKAAFEEEQRARRLAVLAAEEQAREAREALISSNNGVFVEATLRALPADEDAMKAKGIRRAADKITLPASMGADLMRMDAPKNGAMLFELATPSGRASHAGVLDFTGPEGAVLLPRKVVRSLWGREATEPVGSVRVRYVVLEKGTFARFQPASVAFQADCGGEVKEILERALLQHTCLTEGDWLEVWSANKMYDLQVESLEPDRAVSILETDVEAEIAPSIENEAEVAAAEEAARRRLDAEAAAALEAAAAEAMKAARAAAEEERRQAARREKAESLPSELDAATCAEPITTCMARLPGGARAKRSFALSMPAAVLFDWVDSLEGSGVQPGAYRLAAQHPRRVLSPGCEGDIAAAGLMAGQELLAIEPLAE